MDAAFCSYCGAPVATDDRFCSACGRSTDPSAPVTAKTMEIPLRLPAFSRRGKQVGAAVLAILLLGAVGYQAARAQATPERVVARFFDLIHAGRYDAAGGLVQMTPTSGSDLTQPAEMTQQFEAWAATLPKGEPLPHRYIPLAVAGTAAGSPTLNGLPRMGTVNYRADGVELSAQVVEEKRRFGIPQYRLVLPREMYSISVEQPLEGMSVTVNGLAVQPRSGRVHWAFAGKRRVAVSHRDMEPFETYSQVSVVKVPVKPSQAYVEEAGSLVRAYLEGHYVRAVVERNEQLLEGGPVPKESPFWKGLFSEFRREGDLYLALSLADFKVERAHLNREGDLVLRTKLRWKGRHRTVQMWYSSQPKVVEKDLDATVYHTYVVRRSGDSLQIWDRKF
ncbi:MAG: zinc-ribbon domain-containing protein [Bacillota bacterium]